MEDQETFQSLQICQESMSESILYLLSAWKHLVFFAIVLTGVCVATSCFGL